MATAKQRWRGTSNFIADRGPTFALAYGGLICCLLLIGLSAIYGWLGYIPLALATLLIIGYFLVANVWAATQLFDRPGQQPIEVLLAMSHIAPGERVVCVDLGLRESAVAIAQQLTTGRVSVIDVYNPLWNSSAALQRGRLRVRSRPTATDPRLEWLDGEIRLLPLPNGSVSAVFLDQILSEFWQPEDRQTLLKEVWRILSPSGRVLVSERVRSRANWLVLGPWGWQLPTADYWRELLKGSGLALRQEKELQGLIHCFRADKPLPTQGLQLPLHLDLE
jgi:SAM-dependent methyltransferase